MCKLLIQVGSSVKVHFSPAATDSSPMNLERGEKFHNIKLIDLL